MVDFVTQAKWDKLAPRFDTMASAGAEKRWAPAKSGLFSEMEGKVLFLALGTGLDIPFFPKGLSITALDISPKMIEHAQERIAAYDGTIEMHVMDVHDMTFEEAASTWWSRAAPLLGAAPCRRAEGAAPGAQARRQVHVRTHR